jgi:hypothetical protein
MNGATGRLAAALDERFGEGAAARLSIASRRIAPAGRVEVVEVREAGDRATVRTRVVRPDGSLGAEETLELVRAGGTWRLAPLHEDAVFGEGAALVGDALRDALLAAAKAVDALAADVASGAPGTKEGFAARFRAISAGVGKAVMDARRGRGEAPRR